MKIQLKKNLALLLAMVLMGMSMLAGCGKETNGSTENSSAEKETEEKGDSAAENQLEVIKDRGKLLIATSGNFRPLTFAGEDGELTGFDIELGTLIAEKLGVEVEFITGDIAGLLTGMQSGQYDICMSGMTMTEERKKSVDFSETYGQTALIAVTQEDNDKVTGLDDFSGLIVGSLGGTPQYAYTESVGGYDELKDYKGNAEAFQDLKMGRMDVYVVSKIVARDFIENDSDTEHPLKMVGETRNPSYMGIAMPKEQPELKQAIDDILQELMEDGTLDELSEKWFGEVLPRE